MTAYQDNVAAVEMRNISKRFGNLLANDSISLSIRKNSIHGIIGENGAGKTTLMKMLYGMYQPNHGEIWINNRKVAFSSPKDAIRCRIGMVHQHFTLVPSMSVVENVVLGHPPLLRGFIDRKEARKVVKDLLAKYHFDMNLDIPVGELPVGLKQRVEILKALYLGADILILDEPTAVLTPQEIVGLFQTLRDLRDQDASIIIITHKLSEVMALTDEVTVLRDGKVTGHVYTKDANEAQLAQMMVGRGVFLNTEKAPRKPGEEVLCASHISYVNPDGIKVLNDVSFTVRQGEILGIAGVQGNGQTELIEILAGMRHDYHGGLSLCGQEISPQATPWERRKLGLGHIPEDRQTIGSAQVASILDNFLMTTYRTDSINEHGIISRRKAAAQLEGLINEFRIKAPGIKAASSSLSGGNMQKLIFAREYNLKPKLLIAAQPTRGVDIGATEFLHKKLIEMRSAGNAVLLVSNELSEIMSLSDRILVMYKGDIVGEIEGSKATEEGLGLWMAGVTAETKATTEEGQNEF